MIYKLEFLKWKRSGQLWLLWGLFAFFALTSMVMTYYLKDIMESMDAGNLQLVPQKPTWQALFASYLKNAAQLLLLITTYLVALNCTLGNSEALNLFYKTNAKSPWRVFLPKISVSLGVLASALCVGGLCATYVTWAFFDELAIDKIIATLLLQALGYLVFVLFGSVLAIWTGRPFIAAVVVEVIVLVATLFSGVKTFATWAPTSLLQSEMALKQGFAWDESGQAVLFSLFLCAIFLGVLLIRPLKKS